MDEMFKKLPQLRFRGQAPATHYFISDLLTEDSFTHCSALSRIPLELLKNKEQHNETLFLRACFYPFLNSLNCKTRLLAAVSFCH